MGENDFKDFWEEVAERKKRGNNLAFPTAYTENSDDNIRIADTMLMKDILAQMHELTDEVKLLREQLGEKNHTGNSPPPIQETTAIANGPPISKQAAINGAVKNEAMTEAANKYSSNKVPVGNQGIENDEIMPNSEAKATAKKKRNAASVVGNIMFYVLIVALVFGAFLIRSSQNGKPFMVGGYSAMTVLTGSMQDVYPQGSLIVTKSTDTNMLQIGDDITFMTGESSSVTHRIIGITENYLGTGKRGFETKGVMNELPDSEIVSATNVVGKVVFCSKVLGTVAAYITHNWPLLIFAVAVIAGLVAFLKWNAGRPDEKNDKNTADKIT